MDAFATTDDVIRLKGELTNEELETAEALLPVVSNTLRYEAEKVHKDLDTMSANSEAYRDVLKSVTCDIVYRELQESRDSSAQQLSSMSQFTQSALGYSLTGTPANAGGGLFIKKSELARLGLRRQRYGFVDLYGIGDTRQ